MILAFIAGAVVLGVGIIIGAAIVSSVMDTKKENN